MSAKAEALLDSWMGWRFIRWIEQSDLLDGAVRYAVVRDGGFVRWAAVRLDPPKVVDHSGSFWDDYQELSAADEAARCALIDRQKVLEMFQ